MVIAALDRDARRASGVAATAIRHIVVDNLLDADFAHRCADSIPSFARARELGRAFDAHNEVGKVQITEAALFPPCVRELAAALASAEWRATLSERMGIPALLADDELVGAGVQVMTAGGRLDPHVDFNLIAARGLHRRLSCIVYLNDRWEPEWGGELELWNPDVTRREGCIAPVFNRCVVFETTRSSFHSVATLHSPPDVTRRSFATYYYTLEPPAGWDGRSHTTIFRARPDEWLNRHLLTPLSNAKTQVGMQLGQLKRRLGAKVA